MITLTQNPSTPGILATYRSGCHTEPLPVPLNPPCLWYQQVEHLDNIRVIDILEFTRSNPAVVPALATHYVQQILDHFKLPYNLQRAQNQLSSTNPEAPHTLWISQIIRTDASGTATRVIDVGLQCQPTEDEPTGFPNNQEAHTYSLTFVPMDDLLLVPVKMRTILQKDNDPPQILSNSSVSLWDLLCEFWAEMTVDC